MKLRTLIIALLIPAVLSAQQTQSGNGRQRGASEPPAATENTNQGSASASSRQSQQNGSQQNGTQMPWELLSEQIDFVDPGEGVLQWKGRTFDITSSRMFRARFERYLNETYDPVGADEYRAVMRKIQNLLSVGNDVSTNNLDEAFALLFEAGNYEVDGGNSLVLANLVYNAWRVRNELSAARKNIRELETRRDVERRDLRSSTAGDLRDFEAAEERRIRLESRTGRSVRTAGDISETETTNNQTTQSNSGDAVNIGPDGASARQGARNRDQSGSSSSRSVTRPVGAPGDEGLTQTQIDALRLTETEANIAMQRGFAEMSGVNIRLQFQSQIVQLLTQRRFQHALIASDFYRHIFKSSGQTLEVGKERLSAIIPDSDVVPTVDSVGSIARNAISDVNAGMSSVINAYQDRQLISALQRLQETFFLGEFLPPVQLLDPEIKKEFRTLYQNIREVTRLMDLKDFDGVDEIVRKIAERTDDFSAREILAATRTQRTLSNLALNSSRQAASAGDRVQAQELMKQAIEYWPLNPAIQSFSEMAVDLGDARVQARMMFDDSYERGEYRRLYARRTELGIGLADDPERLEKLKVVVQNLMSVDAAIAQAQELQKRGLPYQAWELLSSAREIAPDDPLLNREVANIAPRVASLVARLEIAERMEARGDLTASLIHYLAADDIAPTKTAREGVERLTAKIMELMSPAAPSENTGDEVIRILEIPNS